MSSALAVAPEYLPANPEQAALDTIRDATARRPIMPYDTFIQICADIAEHGHVLKALKDNGQSGTRDFYRWTVLSDEAWRTYARAKALGCHAVADETLTIADNDLGDVGPSGNANVQRARLRIDTRKWHLSKLMPRIYGDKLELSGDGNNPLNIVISKDDDRL